MLQRARRRCCLNAALNGALPSTVCWCYINLVFFNCNHILGCLFVFMNLLSFRIIRIISIIKKLKIDPLSLGFCLAFGECLYKMLIK